MNNYREALINLLREDSGQGLIEYALIAALISLAAITTMPTIGSTIGSIFTNISTSLTTAN
jgi:pilus assembly protein Flp/PilA